MKVIAVPASQWPMLAPKHLPVPDMGWASGDALRVAFVDYPIECVVKDPSNDTAYLVVGEAQRHVKVSRVWQGWHTVTRKRTGPACDGCPDWGVLDPMP